MAQLIIVEGENRGKSFELKRPSETLGRAADNTIVVNDRRVSPNHAEISRNKGGYEIKNLDRSKAILVNGEVFKTTRLQHGDWITIADTTFVFSEDQEPVYDKMELHSIDTDDLLRSQIQGRKKSFEDAESVIESLDKSNSVDQRLKVLLRLVNRLSATLELQRLAEKLAEQVLETFDADRVVVLTMEDERRLKPIATRSKDERLDDAYQPSRTVIREVLNTKEGVLCTDAVDDERFLSGKSLVESNVRSFMYVPCVHQSRVVAILQVDSSKEKSFKEEDLDLLSGIAQFVAVLIENCKVYRKGREYNQQLFHLSRALQRLSSLLDRDMILREVSQIVTRLLGCAKCGILLLHDDGRLHLESVQGMTKETWGSIKKDGGEIGERFCRKVVEEGRPLLVTDIREMGYEPNPRYATRSFVIVPIASKAQTASGEELTKVLGVITVTDKNEANKSMSRTFSGNDQKILDVLAGQLAIALKNAELYEKATVDGLTKVYLRRHFEQRLEENLKECAETAQPLSLLILDIDHFKHTNDTYGHQAGDSVLRGLGALLKKCVRPQNDTVARYGGEEFTVILPGADTNLALKVAQRILRAVSDERFVLDDGREIQKTASLGISTVLPGERETMVRLIKKADYALYEAKETGRNKCVRWSDELLQKLRRAGSGRAPRAERGLPGDGPAESDLPG